MLDDFCFESVSKAIFFNFQIVSGLKIQPKSLACTEEPGKPQSRIRGDVPFAMNHFIDAPGRDIDALGQPVLADSHGAQELLQENLARMDRRKLLSHFVLLVVIHDLHVLGITVRPSEADPPLVVDPDTVMPLPIPAQLFEAVTGRDPKILERFRAIQNHQL